MLHLASLKHPQVVLHKLMTFLFVQIQNRVVLIMLIQINLYICLSDKLVDKVPDSVIVIVTFPFEYNLNSSTFNHSSFFKTFPFY